MCKNTKQKNNYTFDQLDKDMEQLDDTLAKANIPIADRWRLYQPLLSKMPSTSSNTYIVAGLILVALMVIKWDEVTWHFAALGRLAMIKILPYFDWRYLKNEECLIGSKTTNKDIYLDCNLCEAVTDVDAFTINDNVQDVIYTYTSIDRPVIVTGVIDHWPQSSSQLVDLILENPALSTSTPCHVASNVHKHPLQLADVVHTSFDSYFVHLQNCQLEPMKIFRNFTYRPAVLPDELSPVTFNWLLWSNNYYSGTYKKISLLEKYTAIGQIVGSTHFRLVPRKNCQEECAVVEKELYSGDMLIFTSLWDLEYSPEGNGERMSVILEIKG